jgi:hypothetical protein
MCTDGYTSASLMSQEDGTGIQRWTLHCTFILRSFHYKFRRRPLDFRNFDCMSWILLLNLDLLAVDALMKNVGPIQMAFEIFCSILCSLASIRVHWITATRLIAFPSQIWDRFLWFPLVIPGKDTAVPGSRLQWFPPPVYSIHCT